MEHHRVVRALPAILALIVAIATAVYLIGYFAASEIWWIETIKLRSFGAAWQARIYSPAAQIEEYLTGEPVETARTPESEWRKR